MKLSKYNFRIIENVTDFYTGEDRCVLDFSLVSDKKDELEAIRDQLIEIWNTKYGKEDI